MARPRVLGPVAIAALLFGCRSGFQGGDSGSESSGSGSGSESGESEGDGDGDGEAECDPDAAPGDGIFVSALTGDDDAGQGTALLPFASIGVGIQAALASQAHVIYLAQGTYAEAVVVPDHAGGLFIEGGWVVTGSTWTLDCSAGVVGKTVIAAPADASVAVTAQDVVHASGLRRLTVATAGAGASEPDQSGQSLTGVLVSGVGSVFSLADVDVIAGDGGAGGPASAGEPGADGPSPGAEESCTGTGDCSDGTDGGQAPAPGLPADAPGEFDEEGYHPSDGGPGTDGAAGQHGTGSPQGPQVNGNCASQCACNNNSCGSPPTMESGQPGRCGCAGEGGRGGARGRGGGASVAVMIVGDGATLSVVASLLHAGKGGDGSEGGLGGAGGEGSPGVAGAPGVCHGGCATGGGPCENCYSAYPSELAGGAAGGTGGDGATGGRGGAGAGGHAYAVVRIAGGKLLLDEATTLEVGAAGVGAGTGDGKAPDGEAGDELVVP
jgi:hypothetical protein